MSVVRAKVVDSSLSDGGHKKAAVGGPRLPKTEDSADLIPEEVCGPTRQLQKISCYFLARELRELW